MQAARIHLAQDFHNTLKCLLQRLGIVFGLHARNDLATPTDQGRILQDLLSQPEDGRRGGCRTMIFQGTHSRDW